MREGIIYLTTFSATPRTMKMARLMAQRGHSVELLEWDREGTKPLYERLNGLTIRRLRLKSPFGMRAITRIPVWWLFSFVRVLFGKYSVVQARNLDSFLPVFLAAKIRRARLVYDLADAYGESYAYELPFLGPLIRLLEVTSLDNSDAIVMASEGQMPQLKWSPARENWMVFYNIPMDAVPDAEGRTSRDGRVSLVYAGNFGKERVTSLINVGRAIENLPANLVLAGFGEYTEVVRKLFEGKASILGRLSHKEVLKLTATSDVVLLPLDSALSNHRIALSNKFFEAMCCGALVLAPKGTLMGTIVEEEKIGLAVDYSRVDEIKEAISWIASNPNEVAQIRKRAVALFYSRFNPRDVRERYLSTVEPLLNSH